MDMDGLKTTSSSILLSICDGALDSIRNIYLIFVIDKTINEKIEAKERQRLQQSSTSNNSSSSSSSIKLNKEKKKEKKSNVAFRVTQCCLLNGGLFLLSIIFFNHLLMPFLELIITRFTDESIWNYIQFTLSWIFSCIWIVPLFILSKIFNFFWFQDIADASYEFRKGKPTLIPSISLLLADVVFSLIVQSLFICQGMFLSYVPFVGKFLCFVHICLLYSLYSFEYKWFNQGFELHKRLKLVEYNWPYFLGFGLILASLTEFTSDSFVIKGCIFSMFFPLLIISSIDSSAKQRIDFPIQLFWLVVALPNSLVKRKLKPSASNRSSTTPTRH